MKNKILKEIQENYNLICLCRFGSHLYGTDTENSDEDFKGIYLPSKKEIFLGEIKKSVNFDSNKSSEKNTSEDVDVEIYSLHYFIELACKGETVALDMLHVNSENLIFKTKVWDEIVENRERFITKNLKAFIGYARRQAAKYGVKGSRLNAAQEFIHKVKLGAVLPLGGAEKLGYIWSELPINDHAFYVEDTPNGVKQYQICGKTLQSTAQIDYVLKIMEDFVDKFGHRARQAAENKGVDWKAVSHALRAAYQLEELLTEAKITYPLKQAPYLKKVKAGELHFIYDVMPELESMIEKVEKLSSQSNYPAQVDKRFWQDFIYEKVETNVQN